jgi:transposase
LQLIEDADNELAGSFRMHVQRLLDHLIGLDGQVEELEAQIQAWHRASDLSTSLSLPFGIVLEPFVVSPSWIDR